MSCNYNKANGLTSDIFYELEKLTLENKEIRQKLCEVVRILNETSKILRSLAEQKPTAQEEGK